jgi:hypothetical protein
MGDSPGPKGLWRGLQGPLLQVDVSEIVLHEADDPNAVVDLLDAEALPGEHGRDIDLLPVHADAPAGGDNHLAVVEWYVSSGKPS